MAFSVTGTRADGEVTLRVSGDLDIATAPALREAGQDALRDPECSTLRLDIAEVGFMDSTGLGILIGLRNEAGTEKALVVANASSGVQRLLELSGLTGVFTLE